MKPDFKVLGKKLGKNMKAVASALSTMAQSDIIAFEKSGQVTFDIDGTPIMVDLADVEVISEDIPGWLVANEGNLTVALDITLTDELRNEGMARELVNRVQNIRKAKNFDITDKVVVRFQPDERVTAAVEAYGDYIASQVQAVQVLVEPVDHDDTVDAEKDDLKVQMTVEKA